MARLPDATSFGMRPAPSSQAPISGGDASGVRRASAAISRDAATAGQGLGMAQNMALSLADAELGIRTRDDAIERARAINRYNEEAAGELTRLQTEGDFSEREIAEGYTKFLQTKAGEMINGHGGSADSRSALALRLEDVRSHYGRMAASARLEAQQALVGKTLEGGFANLASNAYSAPGRLPELLDAMNTQLDDMGAALTPDQEDAFRATGREQIVLGAMESLLDHGNYLDARTALDQVPSDFLSPQTRRSLEKRITQAEQEEFEADKAGRREVARLEAFLGRPLTQAERVRAAGLAKEAQQPTALMQELEAAGLVPGTAEYKQAILAAKTKPQTTIVNPTQQFGFETAEQRQNAAVETIGSASSTMVATRSMGSLLVQGVQTGPFDSGKSVLKAMASDLGMTIDEMALGKQQEFDRLAKDIALNSMQRFKGAMSDRELAFGQATVTELGKTEEGNVRAIAALQASAEIARENAIRLQSAGDLDGFKVIEREIAERGVDDIIARTEEIETELRARMAASPDTPDEATFKAMTPEQAMAWINRHSEADLDALPFEIKLLLTEKVKSQ